jgi:beta-galactosidase
MIDHKEVAIVESAKDFSLTTTGTEFSAAGDEHTLDIIVENTGRVNGGGAMNTARKGLNGDVSTDEKVHSNYKIYPLEFKQKFVEELKAEKGRAFENVKSPALFRAELDIEGQPRDTFLKLDKWTKGSVFVNGFNVGRYYNKGPQHTLYIPGPYLKTGKNDIFMFELHSASDTIEFVDKPILG